jgi:hypothetical protein
MSLSSVPWSISTAVKLWRVPVTNYPKDHYLSHTVTCPYLQLPEGTILPSHCDVSLSSVSRTISTAVTLGPIPNVSYPKNKYRSHMFHVSLSSITRRFRTTDTLWRVPFISYRMISTTVTLWRIPLINYPKYQYRSHTVTCPCHEIPEVSVPQSHCDLSFSSVTRRNSTAVTLWLVTLIIYPQNQYCSHDCDIFLPSVTRSINTAITLPRAPIIN